MELLAIIFILILLICISIYFGVLYYREKRRADYLEALHRDSMFPEKTTIDFVE